jgi:hypothetical protein
MDKSKTLNHFEEVSQTLFNSYVEEWKDRGNKVLGYNCLLGDDRITVW